MSVYYILVKGLSRPLELLVAEGLPQALKPLPPELKIKLDAPY